MTFIVNLTRGGRRTAAVLATLAALGGTLGWAPPGAAATVAVGAGADLAAAVAAAQPGDVLVLEPGSYTGGIVIDKPLTLQGPPDRAAVIAGTRQGRTLWVKAEDVTLRDLTVTRSGQRQVVQREAEQHQEDHVLQRRQRSEERRVGKEC